MDIKICGLKTADTLATALDAGATHVGFTFFPKSPRNIVPEEAGRLRRAVQGRAKVVAVTVDADNATLDRIVSSVSPDMLQLHGNESPERVAEVRKRYLLPVIKAFSISSAADFEKTAAYTEIADRLLFDAKPPAGSELPGGNGTSFDWRLLTQLDIGGDYMLSGGLTAANVGDAIRLARPRGIDVSSGVERAPGIKDKALIGDFFRAVRAAEGKSKA